jgi:hypothetical protein
VAVLCPNCLTFEELKNRFQGTNSARLYSLAGRFDNSIPTRFLAPPRLFKNSSNGSSFLRKKVIIVRAEPPSGCTACCVQSGNIVQQDLLRTFWKNKKKHVFRIFVQLMGYTDFTFCESQIEF